MGRFGTPPLLLFSKITNKAWYFMRIVCWLSFLFFFQKLGKILQNLSSVAVVIGALRVKSLTVLGLCLNYHDHVRIQLFISHFAGITIGNNWSLYKIYSFIDSGQCIDWHWFKFNTMNFLTFWKEVWANSIDPDQTALNRVFIVCISVAVFCGKNWLLRF